jgi:tetratricopeptide (TPR) repeat protein
MNQHVIKAPEALVYARSAAIYLDDFGSPEVALVYYRKAAALGHEEKICLDGIARCYLKLGDYDMALRYYSQYVDAGYFSIGMSVNYAYLLVRSGKPEDALSCLQRAFGISQVAAVREQLQTYIDQTQAIIDKTSTDQQQDSIFDRYVARAIPVLRALRPPKLLPFNERAMDGCAVIVETRRHPWLEHSLRNVAHFLAPGWSMLIIHGHDNAQYVKDLLDEWRMAGIIGTHNLDVASMTRIEYSNLLKQAAFWDLIPAPRALIFQTDAMLLRTGMEAFYAWDFIGAPWNDFHVPEGVGNGGLSMRNVSTMRILSGRYGVESPTEEMEDVFFARMMHLHGQEHGINARLATRQAAHAFCAEWRLRDLPVADAPLGLHQAWRGHSTEQVERWFAQADAGYASSTA